MTEAWLLDKAWVLISILGGYLLKSLFDAVRELRVDLKALAKSLADAEVELPKAYVRKADLDSKLSSIEGHLLRIEHKLDGKADK